MPRVHLQHKFHRESLHIVQLVLRQLAYAHGQRRRLRRRLHPPHLVQTWLAANVGSVFLLLLQKRRTPQNVLVLELVGQEEEVVKAAAYGVIRNS